MIVVDTNVIHYCWVRGQNTEIAQAVRQKDPEWHVPILWRSELRNVLTAYLSARVAHARADRRDVEFSPIRRSPNARPYSPGRSRARRLSPAAR